MRSVILPVMRMCRLAAPAALIMALTAPLGAVGLGPLSSEGVIDGPRRGFSLTLLNPYAEKTEFRAYAVGADNELPQLRVNILPAIATLGPRQSRRLLVIADELAAGETYSFRVCAERSTPPEGLRITARVCSKLSAHRIP